MTIDLSFLLTIVIITFNRREELAGTLRHLLALPEKFPIILVDNASTDGTGEMVREQFSAVEYHRLNKNSYAGARNVGAELARTPFVAFTDDDCRWQPGALARAVEDLQRCLRVAAIAPCVLVRGERPDPLNRYFETSPLPRSVDMPGPSLAGYLEGSVVMRREAFLATGGYDHHAMINGEGRRVAVSLIDSGWGISYDSLVVCHHFPSEMRNTAKRQRNGARNAITTAVQLEPWENVLQEIGLSLREAARHPSALVGIMEALVQMPVVLPRRQPISPRMREIHRLLREQKKNMQNY